LCDFENNIRKESGAELMIDGGPDDLSGFVEFGEQAVAEAVLLLERYFRKTTAMAKGRFDVVTDADHAVESMFAQRLARAFPDHAMVGEETGQRSPRVGAEYCWVLDPLDGTINFAAHQPFFAVSLGLFHRGIPVIGWVNDPVHDERFRAVDGQGATLNGAPLGPTTDQNAVLPVGLSTGFLEWALRTAGPGIMTEVIKQFGKIRIFGSQALHLCYVAAGRLRLAASVEAKLWDDAAGALIVTESGRTYAGLDGRSPFPLDPDSPLWHGRANGSMAADLASIALMREILRSFDRLPVGAGGVS
jgi:myo-inositol-1(or 4)-monophosphatase